MYDEVIDLRSIGNTLIELTLLLCSSWMLQTISWICLVYGSGAQHTIPCHGGITSRHVVYQLTVCRLTAIHRALSLATDVADMLTSGKNVILFGTIP